MSKTYGTLLKELRLAACISLVQAARVLGISAPYLTDIEHGRRQPPPPELREKIAAMFRDEGLDLASMLDKGEDYLEVELDHLERLALKGRGEPDPLLITERLYALGYLRTTASLGAVHRAIADCLAGVESPREVGVETTAAKEDVRRGQLLSDTEAALLSISGRAMAGMLDAEGG